MRFIFGADTVPTAVSEKYFINGDVEKLFGNVINYFKSADKFFINLECALTQSDTPIKKIGPALKGSPECVNGLVAMGVTEVCLANNHSYDYGERGLRDTMAVLDEAGIPYLGVGDDNTDSRKPYFFECDGKRFSVINVCEHEYSYALDDRCGANPFDPYLTMQDIRMAKSLSDYTFVVYHGGKENCRYPSERLHDLCHEMVLSGADVVLCQHSHCIGCYESFAGGHIVYGQGNLNFLGFGNLETWQTGMAVEIIIESGALSLAFHPLVFTDDSASLATGEQMRDILRDFAKRNESLKNGEWINGWKSFCESVRESYTSVMFNAFKPDPTEKEREFFGHYLDCEAHLDVLHEIFPTWNRTVKQ